MPTALQAVLEIFKYIIPAMVVFFTVYHIMKTYLNAQLRMKQIEMEDRRTQKTLPLKLQAYERLSLLCERIKIPMLAMRLNSSSMTPDELWRSMLIAVQKEFEHNMTQQVYVSEALWRIISLAKDEVLQAISDSMNRAKNGEQFDVALNQEMAAWTIDPVNKALSAIRQEVSLHV